MILPSTFQKHRTHWDLSNRQDLQFTSLDKNIDTDVVIVGGGIAGITTAYRLLQSGKNIVLVDGGTIAGGETGSTTGHLASALYDGYLSIARNFGAEGARLIANSHTEAIDFIEHTVKAEQIDCGFIRVCGYLFKHNSDWRTDLVNEMEKSIHAGLNVHYMQSVPGFKTVEGPCLKFEDQGQFHPLQYITGMCRVIRAMGGQIHTHTTAADISHKGIVTDKGFTVSAQHVVLATNAGAGKKYAAELKQNAYRSYVIGCRIRKNSVRKALWWDTGDYTQDTVMPPYHYVQVTDFDDMHDLLLCGGEDHPSDMEVAADERYALLAEWVRERFHDVQDIIYQWNGLVMESQDAVAFIGRNPQNNQNIYVATGGSGNGLTYGTIAGLLITDLINGVKNKWEKLYDPARFKLYKADRAFLHDPSAQVKPYISPYPAKGPLFQARA